MRGHALSIFKFSEGSAHRALRNDPGNRYSATTIMAAITGRIKDLPALVDINPSKSNGLKKRCAANLSYIRTVSQARLISRIGTLEDGYFLQIRNALLISCGF
jgi:mRNA interferase MazF